MGKHSAAPASSEDREGPRPETRAASTAGARHSAAAPSRGGYRLPADEPIELLAEPLSEPLTEPLAAIAEPRARQPVERLAEHLTPPPPVVSHRSHVSRHAHSRVDERPARTGRGRRMAAYALAALLTAAAWAVLVYLAIQLGPDVKRGETRAWVLMTVATIGAMGCLFLALVLGGRVLEALRRPARITAAEPSLASGPMPGGRRAKR